jgi:hypothetical protein
LNKRHLTLLVYRGRPSVGFVKRYLTSFSFTD